MVTNPTSWYPIRATWRFFAIHIKSFLFLLVVIYPSQNTLNLLYHSLGKFHKNLQSYGQEHQTQPTATPTPESHHNATSLLLKYRAANNGNLRNKKYDVLKFSHLVHYCFVQVKL